MKKIEDIFEQVNTKLGRVIFIIGDAGVGKTELANQFQRRLGDKAFFLVGKFYEYGSDSPYRPYLDGLYSFTRNFPDRSTGGWSRLKTKELTGRIRQDLDEIDGLINVNAKEKVPSVEEQIKYRTFE